MFVIGAAGTVVSFTLPEQIEAGHVDFARQLAAKAWALGRVERRYRGLPPLPDVPVPYTLTAQARLLPIATRDTRSAARRAGGDGRPPRQTVVQPDRRRHPVLRPLTASTHPVLHPPMPRRSCPSGRGGDITITNPGRAK
jgi:hypothetical protein